MDKDNKDSKMNFTKLGAFLILAVTLNFNANAGLIQSDYLTSGDNLAVLDTSSNLQWLDLSVSTSWSFSNWNTFIQPANNWRLATNTEVVNLFSSAFPTYSALYGLTGWVDTNDANLIQNFIDYRTLFGTTLWNNNGVDTYGLYKNANGVNRMMGVSRWMNTYRIFSNNFNLSPTELKNGLYIVRNVNTSTVPEPSTFALFALSLVGIASRKLNKRK